MNKNYRLTVHLENVKKVQGTTGKKVKGANGKFVDETKSILCNTMSWYFKTKDDCHKKLADVRTKYTIAKGKNPKKMHKMDKELWNISFVN